jgi:hypothetical protein
MGETMKIKPWFKFDPSSWLNDVDLRDCTTSERGVLIDLMCLAHRSGNYGYFMDDMKPETIKKTAKCLSIASKTLDKCLTNLLQKSRICQTNDGQLYIKRMIEDNSYSLKQSELGKTGGNPTLKAPLKPEKRREDKEKEKSKKKAYGEFNSVMLTDDEYDKLISKHGESKALSAIEILDGYIASKGNKYKNHYAVFKKGSWVWERVAESKGQGEKYAGGSRWISC